MVIIEDLATGDLGDLATGDLATGDLATGDLATGDLDTGDCYGRYRLIRTSLDEEPAKRRPLRIRRPLQLSLSPYRTVVPDKQRYARLYNISYGRAP